ncbi:hydroxyacylglutathione hydrolase [Limnohabitans planktonicus]|uniref:Hydroxyacylglutathione hydrolase n=1 Tax=Limnohabitans planktonicus II-D5 TaxID=1293045 RepID=A0A2T7UCN8_9BURK|nr:hydroxyacylglutathione hydrolase [Limnohabitans planktonicus]PVE42466.1 hydroxyacylglutathione hydrolase [Limnohabitans planktonicus II-D5]|eukprot:gene24649-31017_t
MKLIALPAFSDNYIWLLHDDHHALVVDPGESAPVRQWLQQHPHVQLDLILVTHHHADHTGGVADLVMDTQARVLTPAMEPIPLPSTSVKEGDLVNWHGLNLKVLDVPGHTAGHVAFWGQPAGQDPVLFCGDTLFSGGCGRLFEGTPAQMLDSLDRLAALPGNTRVCCAHEYTLSNLKFALAVDPGNTALQAYAKACHALRDQGLPTLPVALSNEQAINPFLRSRSPSVAAAVKNRDAKALDDIATFAALRAWKNEFR